MLGILSWFTSSTGLVYSSAFIFAKIGCLGFGETNM